MKTIKTIQSVFLLLIITCLSFSCISKANAFDDSIVFNHVLDLNYTENNVLCNLQAIFPNQEWTEAQIESQRSAINLEYHSENVEEINLDYFTKTSNCHYYTFFINNLD